MKEKLPKISMLIALTVCLMVNISFGQVKFRSTVSDILERVGDTENWTKTTSNQTAMIFVNEEIVKIVFSNFTEEYHVEAFPYFGQG